MIQRHNKCQKHRESCNNRSINACKTRDEFLCFCFAAACILDELHNLRSRGFTEFLRCADFQNAAEIDAAAGNIFTLFNCTRNSLTCKRRCIKRRCTVDDNTVNRYALARTDDNNRADLYIVRVDLFKLPVLALYVCRIRNDVHKSADVIAAFAHRIALKPLTNLIKPHNGNCFCVITVIVKRKGNSTDCRDSHQKAFVKSLTVFDTLKCFNEDIIPDDEVWNHIKDKTCQSFDRHEFQRQHHRARNSDAN